MNRTISRDHHLQRLLWPMVSKAFSIIIIGLSSGDRGFDPGVTRNLTSVPIVMYKELYSRDVFSGIFGAYRMTIFTNRLY